MAGSGAAVGLALGGILTEFAGWRWCLLVNLVFTALGIVGAAKFLKESRTSSEGGHDLWGGITVTLGFGSLVYGLTLAEDGWTSTTTLAFLALGLGLLALFVVIEAKTAHPILPLRILRDRTRAGAFFVQAVIGAVYIGSTLFQAYHLQVVLQLSPLVAGFATLPMAVSTMAMASLSTKLFQRFGGRYVMTAGLVIAAAGMLYLAQLTLDGSYWAEVLPGLLLVGVGLSGVVVPLQNVALTGVGWNDAGAASAVVNSLMQLGGSIGLALFTALFIGASGGQNTYEATGVEGYAAVYLGAAAALLAGAVVAAALIRTPGVSAPNASAHETHHVPVG